MFACKVCGRAFDNADATATSLDPSYASRSSLREAEGGSSARPCCVPWLRQIKRARFDQNGFVCGGEDLV